MSSILNTIKFESNNKTFSEQLGGSPVVRIHGWVESDLV